MGNALARAANFIAESAVAFGTQLGIALAIAAAVAVATLIVAKNDKAITAAVSFAVVTVIAGVLISPFGAVSGNDSRVRQPGYELVNDEQATYEARPPLAVCTAKLASELGGLAGDPIRSSVNYVHEDGEGRCTIVVDQRSIRRGLIGVVEWNYTTDTVERCEASGIPAWRGWAGNSFRGDAASEKLRRSVATDDLIGRCGEFGAEVYAPALQQTGTGAYTHRQHGGVYRFAAESDSGLATTTWHASGDAETFGFSAPFYPARLAAATIAGHRNADASQGWFRRAGIICPSDSVIYEAVERPSTDGDESGAGVDGNVREFTLMREDGSQLDAVTPMTRCGSSESVAATAVMQLDTFEAGKHNPVVVHERDEEMLPLAQMAQAVAETPEVRVASRLRIHEVTPLSHDVWAAQVGTERLVTFAVQIPTSGRVTVEDAPFGDADGELDDLIADDGSDMDVEVDDRGDTQPVEARDGELDELRDEIARLADQVETLTETLTDAFDE